MAAASRSAARNGRTLGFWLGFIAGVLTFEAGYRVYQYIFLAIDAHFPVATIDAPAPSQTGRGNLQGYFLPNRDMVFSFYQADGVSYETHRVKTNNLGWISHHDYEPRKPGEYRIAVVGDSFTASLTNSLPWSDVVGEVLNRDKAFLNAAGVGSVSVMNLGAVGATLPFMANPLAVIAKRLDVDMLIVNIITETLAREDNVRLLAEQITDLDPEWGKTSGPVEPDYVLDEVGLNLYCTGGPRVLTNPDCKTSPFWVVPPGVSFPPEKILAVKRAIARQRYLWTVLLTWKPLLLQELFARVISSAIAQEPPAVPRGVDTVAAGVRALEFMTKLGLKPVVTHNPIAADLAGTSDRGLFNALVARAQGRYPIFDMRAYLPIQGGRSAWDQWYTPGDGHWNDNGAKIYGAAVARFVKERIRAERNLPPDPGELACASLYERFESLMKAKAQAKAPSERFVQDLRRLVEELPSLEELSTRPRTYADCGFAVDAYFELALAAEERDGDNRPHQSDWEAALRLANDPGLLLDRRYRRRLERGDKAGGLADLSELIRLRPDATDLVLQRGDLRLAGQDPGGALEDFKLVRQRTGPMSTQFRIMQAQWLLGDFQGVVATATEGLAQSPVNGAYYHLRASAKEKLGRRSEALADYNAAIAIAPSKTLFQLRANVFDALKRHEEANADRQKANMLQ
jgi:tetratricopeptide (TPR) repeat protein